MKSRFVKCVDGAEAIEICLDNEEPCAPLIYISMWKLGNDNRPLSFKEKLIWIWNIIKTGNPWADQIVFNHSEYKKFCYVVNDIKEDMDKSYKKWIKDNGVEVI